MQDNDLISRAALLAAYDAAHKGPPGGARKLIAEAPAVDAVPVVHAKWEPSEKYHGYYCCSNCRNVYFEGMYIAYLMGWQKWAYCPH